MLCTKDWKKPELKHNTDGFKIKYYVATTLSHEIWKTVTDQIMIDDEQPDAGPNGLYSRWFTE